MKTSGVYLIRCSENGKVYVGSAFRIEKRWQRHRDDLQAGVHHSKHLQRAWMLYGPDAFDFSVIEIVPERAMLVQREQVWIDHYHAADPKHGFNINPTAGSSLGVKRTMAARQRMSDLATGRIMSNEAKAKIGDAHRGSKSHKAKLTEADVRKIKRRLIAGDNQERIAEEFDVTATTITDIRKSRTWTHVLPGTSIPDGNVLGSRHWKSKLTEADVRKIKTALLSDMTVTAVAAKFHVSFSTVADIDHDKTWTQVVVAGWETRQRKDRRKTNRPRPWRRTK